MATVKNMAKITAPRVQDILPRPRLFELLETQCGVPLIWIYGPPGAGKTTLAASYVENRGRPCLWYRVDAGDNDVATFFYYASLAAKNMASKRAVNLPLYTVESSDGFEAFARSYFRQLFALFEDGAVLVFDNCHELQADTPFLTALAIAAEELPQRNSILCISRNAPPQVFSKLQMYNQCREIDWQTIRFTIEESQALLRRLQVNYPEAGLAWLHEKTRGWVSGLILLARNSKPGDKLAAIETLPESTALFGYLAQEVFEKLTPEVCDFLMVAALLPEMTVAAVQELTGHAQAERQLNELAGKGYFLECSAGTAPVYQFHPLCRDFLLARGRSSIDAERLSQLQKQAAKILDKMGNTEQAIELYKLLGCWPQLKKLLLDHAEQWICCGRHRSLIQWLECIPEEAVGDDDFYRYWLGIAYVPVDSKRAYTLLEQAHESFLARTNAEWSYRSWFAIIETICFARGDFEPLKKWIIRFGELREQFPFIFAPELKAKVYSSAVLAMSILDTQNPWLTETVKLSEYAVRLVPIELFQQAVLINLGYYYNFTGNFSRFRVFAPKLKKALDNEKLPPAARILAAVMLMLLAVCNGDDEALEFYDYGINLAERTGVYLFNGLLHAFNIYHYAVRGDVKAARQLLEQAIDKTPQRFSHDHAHYTQIAAWLAALEGDMEMALAHNSLALELEQQLHYPFGIALTKDLNVLLLAKQGRCKEAAVELEEARRIVSGLSSNCLTHKLDLSAAWLGYLHGDEAELVKNLRSGFALGRAENIQAWYGLLPEMLQVLCCKAMEYDIETPYTQRLIRSYKLFPEQPPLHLENWPWGNHFYTLGRFAIFADGKELEYNGKTPVKVLELLQVIIAFGGSQVDSLAVSEVLWPDSDGDNAQQALETALFRLRKLVGKDSITVCGGKISLNKKRCWLDVWAFEQQLEQLDSLLQKPHATNGEKLDTCLTALSRLYRGPLFGDACPSWAEAVRTRLQNKYHKALKSASAYYNRAENSAKAEYFLDKLSETGTAMQGGFYLQ